MTFTVRWPDGQVSDLYSPSLVMHDHLTIGARYTVAEFTAASTHALAIASERVRAKFGFACTSAMATTESIHARAARFAPGESVTVLAMEPPLT
ncbi:MAG: MSMEG_0570 family nitrogen starvation response protein [Nocardioides sp.]|uniref:MSMEG_0570 family nitrogen starvation response protein n=1 Tax=Nocardioides sp. TaxID=35761 RepID=UPI0039E61A0A